MKVASVSSVYYRPQCRKGALKQHSDENSGVVQKDVSFKGNFGKIVGGTLGTGAVVAASFFAAPAIICLAGMGAGDVAEDKINKEGEYKKDKDEKK